MSILEASDELDDYARDQWKDPGFRAAYEAELKRIKRAYLGYGGLAVNGREYQRRLKARRRRRR